MTKKKSGAIMMSLLVEQRVLKKGSKFMTNIELLEAKIKESGKKKCYLAERLGVSRATFRALCSGKRQFRTEQVNILCEELGIVKLKEKETIFFA